MPKVKVQGLLGGSAKKISKAVGGSMSKGKNPSNYMTDAKPAKYLKNTGEMKKATQVGRFEGAGSRAGAAVDRGIATAGSYANRAKSVATNAVNKVKEGAGVAKAYVKKKERSAAYQVGKLVTGQTKNQNANRRAGRVGYAGIAATGTAIGSLGAHAANNYKGGSSTGNETSQNYNSSSWSSHKKSQRGY